MMNIRKLLLIAVLCFPAFSLLAQDAKVHPSELGTGTYYGLSKPLRDLPAMSHDEFLEMGRKARERKELNEGLKERSYPYAASALPKGPDAVWQQTMGTKGKSRAPIANFDGQNSPYFPPDCNGTAGPSHYMQTINTVYSIYSKTGTLLAGPTNLNLLFGNVPGAGNNDGDPVALYDGQADRWLICEFSISGATNYMLMAVSSTNDPTGTWHQYSFVVSSMPDYPKFGIWQDGYYMGDNNSSGNDIYVFERDQMLIGGISPKMVGFNNPNRPSSVDGFMCVPPVDNDGAFAPAGSPGLFIAMNDDAFGGGTDQLWIYELAVNWTTLASSTFSRTQQIDVAPFNSNFGNNWDNIKQPGTNQKLDAIPQVIMNVPQYRNFGSYQTLVCCHSVDVDNTKHAGIRWYELRRTSGIWSVRQQGTYAPDADSRWLGSIMMNGSNELGLGYSVSSSTVYPSIRFCGQTAEAYASASGILDFPESVIVDGANSQTGYNRWGDYSGMSVDPADDQTFWYTNEYIGSGGSRKTKIASFQVGPVAPTSGFAANTIIPCLNNTVIFTDQTTGGGISWLWSFTPATVTFVDGTSNTSTNPHVTFNALGTYTVALTVTNLGGSNTATKSNYIAVNIANADFDASSTTVVINNTTTFTDASTCEINSWLWNFGADATPTTATTKGPHLVSYSTTGLKTVSLTVNGNLTDTKSDYINVLDDNFNMSSTTLSTCNGNFYDPGGPSLNYENNQNFTMTFKPSTTGAKLQFIFSSFELEYQAACNNDYLKIFDGPNMFSPIIGKYCGTNSPDTITATGVSGAITFVFHSNVSITKPGWVATVNCIDLPVANPETLTAIAAGSSQINLAWTLNAGNNDVLLAWSPTQTFGIPVDGITYVVGDTISGGGKVIYKGNGTVYSHSMLTPSTTYNYKAFSLNASSKYSVGLSASATTDILPMLSVTPPIQNVTSPEGSTLFAVLSNSSWTVVSDQPWCAINPNGTGNGTITANFTQNLSITPRVAYITVTIASLLPITVTVIQDGAAPILLITPSNQVVADPAGNTTFTVTSNTNWAVASNQSWCLVNPTGSGAGTIVANFAQNLIINQRVANITVSVAGLAPIVVTVTQAGAAPILVINPSDQRVSAYASSVNYLVTSNTDWTASADSVWCIVTGSGSGNGNITANYAFNPYDKERVTKISVSAAGLSQVVTLTQGHEVASVPDHSSIGIRIYPNPSKGEFSIVVDKAKYPTLQVTISDLAGAVLMNHLYKGESEYHFDMGTIPQGCYFVKIKAGNELMTKKLVIIN